MRMLASVRIGSESARTWHTCRTSELLPTLKPLLLMRDPPFRHLKRVRIGRPVEKRVDAWIVEKRLHPRGIRRSEGRDGDAFKGGRKKNGGHANATVRGRG